MKTQALFLFLILIAGLILCCCFGVKEGFDIQTYTGVNSAQTNTNAGSNSGIAVGPQGNIYTTSTDVQTPGYDNYNHYDGSSQPTLYYGQNGSTAKLMSNNGSKSLIVTDSNGNTTTYTTNNKLTGPNPLTSLGISNSNIFYGMNGGYAFIKNNNGSSTVQVSDNVGNIKTYLPYNSQTYDPNYPNVNGNDASAYSSSLPPGIPASQIPAGQQDLYILKSQVVPPVCPACPTTCQNGGGGPSKCPPCPACARCPDPSMKCKLVPNYNTIQEDELPQPVLNKYSTFGM